MIWLRLKLDLLPCIAQEVEKVQSDYTGKTREILPACEVRAGDKNAYRNLVLLQANVTLVCSSYIGEVRARIEEFERFYERFYADYRIGYFEKLKLRLRKLLNPQMDVNRMIYQDTHATRKTCSDALQLLKNEQILTTLSTTLKRRSDRDLTLKLQSHLLDLQQQAKMLYQKKSQQQQLQPYGEVNEVASSGKISTVASPSVQKQEVSVVQGSKAVGATVSIAGSRPQTAVPTTSAVNKKPQSRSPAPAPRMTKSPMSRKTAAAAVVGATKTVNPSTPSNQTAAKKGAVGSGVMQGAGMASQPQSLTSSIGSQQQQQPAKSDTPAASSTGGSAQVDEIVFTIRMTKEEYLKYLQAKSMKNK